MKILKGRFKTVDSTIYGLFYIAFSDDGSYIEQSDIITSNDSSVFNLVPGTANFRQYQEKIQNVKMKGSFIQSMTKDLFNSLNGAAQDESFFGELYRYISDDAKDKIKFMLKNLFYRNITGKDSELVIETASEEGSLQVETPAEPAASTAATEGGGGGGGEQGTYVTIKLALSPIKGRFLTDLSLGDRIMVRLDPTQPRAKAYIEKAELRDGSDIAPAPATIVRMEKTDAGREIHVKLEEGLFGKATEEEGVKVAVYDPAGQRIQKSLKVESASPAAAPAQKAAPAAQKESGGPPAIFFLFGGLLTVIIILIYFLLNI